MRELFMILRLAKPLFLVLVVVTVVTTAGELVLSIGGGLLLGPAMLWANVVDPNLPRLVQLPLLLVLFASFLFFAFSWKPWRGRSRKEPSPGSSTHGSADWGDPTRLATGRGLVVGRSPAGADGFLRSASPGLLLRYERGLHLLTCASTGAGKGTGAVIPALLTYPGSVLCIDPKGENFAVSGRRRWALGSVPRALDPFDVAGGTATFNPLDLVAPGDPDAIDNARLIADMLVTDAPGQRGDARHWNEEARALLAGLILYAASSSLPADRNLPRVREMVTLSGEDFRSLTDEMQRSGAAGGLVARATNRLLSKSDRERSGVLSTAQRATHFLDSPRMTRHLARSSLDLQELKSGNISVFLVLPPARLGTYRAYLRLVAGCAVLALLRGRPAARLDPPALFLLDEFASLGPMEPMRKAVSLLRGYGGQFWLFVQDLGQLRSTYGSGWETFVGNADLVQFFGVQDQFTAEYVSKLAGDTTVQAASANRSRGRSSRDLRVLGGSNRAHSRGYSEARRRLLTPDEVRRLSPEELLLFQKGERPVRARRVRYFADEEFAGLYDPNPMETPAA